MIMDYVELVRKLIMDNGFMTETQVRLRLYELKLDSKEVSRILNKIRCSNIHRIKYTNSYIVSLKDKYLFYYLPPKVN